jgi:hypothetical protein
MQRGNLAVKVDLAAAGKHDVDLFGGLVPMSATSPPGPDDVVGEARVLGARRPPCEAGLLHSVKTKAGRYVLDLTQVLDRVAHGMEATRAQTQSTRRGPDRDHKPTRQSR